MKTLRANDNEDKKNPSTVGALKTFFSSLKEEKVTNTNLRWMCLLFVSLSSSLPSKFFPHCIISARLLRTWSLFLFFFVIHRGTGGKANDKNTAWFVPLTFYSPFRFLHLSSLYPLIIGLTSRGFQITRWGRTGSPFSFENNSNKKMIQYSPHPHSYLYVFFSCLWCFRYCLRIGRTLGHSWGRLDTGKGGKHQNTSSLFSIFFHLCPL